MNTHAMLSSIVQALVVITLLSLILLILPSEAVVRGEKKQVALVEDDSVDKRNNNNDGITSHLFNRQVRGGRRLHADKPFFGDDWSVLGRGGIGALAKGEGREILPMQVRVLQDDSTSLYIVGYPLEPRFAAPGTPLIEVETASPPSEEPSESPTTAPSSGSSEEEIPRNDACATAREISYSSQGLGVEGAIKISDTSIGARRPTVAPSRCGRITNSSPGVWFKVLGSGEVMTASLCWPGTAFDTKMTIYTNENGNENDDCSGVMTCVGANDDASGGTFGMCMTNRQASRTQWWAQDGIWYYILVHGFGNREGDFELNVFTYSPTNDRCEEAESIQPLQGLLGTTYHSSVDFGGDVEYCNGVSAGDVGGVWYQVIGTGQTLRASTCNEGTDFDTRMHVFATYCHKIVPHCIDANDDFDESSQCSVVEWFAKWGTRYYVLIHGKGDNGVFELSIDVV